MRRFVALLLSSATLSGCASVPDVTIPYYLPAASTRIKVLQTIACNSSGTRIAFGHSVSLVTEYGPDTANVHWLRIKSLGGRGADTTAKIERTEDGRLSGINATTKGQGDKIVDAAIKVAGSGASIGMKMLGAPVNKQPGCAEVLAWGGDKGVAISYVADYPSRDGAPLKLTIEPASIAVYKDLAQYLPKLELTVSPAEAVPSITRADNDTSRAVDVYLAKQVRQTFSLYVHSDQPAFAMNGLLHDPLWTQTVMLPTVDTYAVPIPRGSFFGGNGFSLALSPSGAVTSIGYDRTPGAAAVAGNLASAADAYAGSTAARAAQYQAQADLIAQQQRLTQCEADASTCSP